MLVLFLFRWGAVLFDFLLLEARFRNRKEEGALEGVLFTMLADLGLSIGEDIASNFAATARVTGTLRLCALLEIIGLLLGVCETAWLARGWRGLVV